MKTLLIHWRALRVSTGPILEHAFLIFDTALRLELLE